MSGRTPDRMLAPTVEQVAAASLSPGTHALPHGDRLQPLFGDHDLGTIRVSDGAQDVEARRRVLSSGFTLGERVSLPRDAPVALAEHEAVHVVQHRLGGAPAEPVAEAQADRLAQLAVSGRSIARELSGAGRTAYGGATAGPARLRRAPNQAGTTDPDHVVSWVAGHEAGRTPSQVLDTLSDAPGGNTDRYFLGRALRRASALIGR